MNGGIIGKRLEARLPFTLSREATRAVTIASGLEPESVQHFEVGDLIEVGDAELRTRVVDVWDRIQLATDGTPPAIRRFGPLHWSARGWWLRADHDVLVHGLVHAAPGRTRTVLELAASESDAAPMFWRSIWTAPEIGSLNERETVDLQHVLAAYERTLDVADRAAVLAREARYQTGGFVLISEDGEHITIAPPDPEEEQIRIDLVRGSDPASFDTAIQLVRQISELPPHLVRAFAVEATSAAFYQLDPETETDASIVNGAIEPASQKVLQQVREEMGQATVEADYARERARWIKTHGSERLKRAAARGYKHDGIYRDERLARELPGYIGTLPRKADVREAINPSADALEAESEILTQIQKGDFGDVEARIVWVGAPSWENPGSGEYVQLKGYLGRHSVYRPVSLEENDDIPF